MKWLKEDAEEELGINHPIDSVCKWAREKVTVWGKETGS